METTELIESIIDSAKEVRKHLTPGYEENIYKNAMYIELRSRNIPIQVEKSFCVTYKGHILGNYRADLIADDRVIIELKATKALTPINSIQLVNYLTATGIDDGLLINFGSEKIEIRHKSRLYQQKPV